MFLFRAPTTSLSVGSILKKRRLGANAGKFITKSHTCRPLRNPDNSMSLLYWDVAGGCLLAVVTVLTPFEAGFLDSEPYDFLWVLNILMTTYFSFDMVLQFFIPFEKPTRFGRKWVTAPGAIAKNYTRRWFWVDLVTVIPFEVIVPGQSLQALRTIRLLRLIKLLRLLRGFRITQRWQAEGGYSYRKTMLYWIFLIVVVISHWFACVLGIISRLQGEKPPCQDGMESDSCMVTWLTVVKLYDVAPDATSNMSVATAYLISLHCSMSILVHPHAYGPTNNTERCTYIGLMMLGGFIWTQVISRSTAIFTSLERHNIAYHQTMDDLNMLSDELALPSEMRIRLRKFFLRMRERDKHEQWQKLMQRMSPQLRRDTARAMNMPWVRRIRFLARCRIGFLTDVAEKLQLRMYTEKEHFGELFHMYIMMAGLVTRRTQLKVMAPGMAWAEDHVLLSSVLLLEDNTAVSVTITEVQSLWREDFQLLLEEFDEEKQLIRQQTLKYAFIRGVRRLAQEYREAKQRAQEQEREECKVDEFDAAPAASQPSNRASSTDPIEDEDIQLEDTMHVIQKRMNKRLTLVSGERRKSEYSSAPSSPQKATTPVAGSLTALITGGGSMDHEYSTGSRISRQSTRRSIRGAGGTEMAVVAEVRNIAAQQATIVKQLKAVSNKVKELHGQQQLADIRLRQLCGAPLPQSHTAARPAPTYEGKQMPLLDLLPETSNTRSSRKSISSI